MIDCQATNLISLANALVIDLGLNRWPLDYGKANFLMFKEGSTTPLNSRAPWKQKHTPDEMRAALGAFYTTSLCVIPPFQTPSMLTPRRFSDDV